MKASSRHHFGESTTGWIPKVADNLYIVIVSRINARVVHRGSPSQRNSMHRHVMIETTQPRSASAICGYWRGCLSKLSTNSCRNRMVHRVHAGSFSGFRNLGVSVNTINLNVFDRRWPWQHERTHPLPPQDVHVAPSCASMRRSDIDLAFFAASKALRRANVAPFFFSPFKFKSKALEEILVWDNLSLVFLVTSNSTVPKICEPAAVVDRVPCSKALNTISQNFWIFFIFQSCLFPTFFTPLTQFKTTCTFRAWNSCNSIKKCGKGQEKVTMVKQALWDLCCIQNSQWQKQMLTCWLAWMDQWTKSLARKC